MIPRPQELKIIDLVAKLVQESGHLHQSGNGLNISSVVVEVSNDNKLEIIVSWNPAAEKWTMSFFPTYDEDERFPPLPPRHVGPMGY